MECEIAARLSRDLPETGIPYDRGNVADAVGALMAGIELVDDRYDDCTVFRLRSWLQMIFSIRAWYFQKKKRRGNSWIFCNLEE